jgi:protein HOOK3
LKKKIQALQEQERTNANMRRDLAGAQEALAETDRLRERCAALEKANEENAKTIANGEQEIFDQKTAKEQLKYELKVLGQRYEQTREMLAGAQETIRELEDNGPSTEDTEEGDDLDAELNAEPGSTEDAEKKAAKRKSVAHVPSADTIVLQQNLSIATASVARLEQRCLDLLQENLGFKSVLEDKDANTEHPFQHQVKRLETLEKDVEDIQAKYTAATSEAADLRRLLELSESQGTYISPHLQNTSLEYVTNHFSHSIRRPPNQHRRTYNPKPRSPNIYLRTANSASRAQIALEARAA